MEPITTTIAVVTALTTAVAIRQYSKLQEKNEEIDALLQTINQYSSTYSFEPCDRELIEGSRAYLNSRLKGGTLAELLEGKTAEEKQEIARDIAENLARIMKVKVSEINIQPLSEGTLGSELVDDKGNIILYLNVALLEYNPDKMIFVMLHELRHAVQDSALRDDVWGFSDSRKAQWLIGNMHYVRADSKAKLRAYYYQILETDANAYANAVLKK